MRAIIAGGGTGGHVIPALAIAHELKASYDCEVCFVGTARGIETRLVPAAGFDLQLIEVGQLNRVSLATRLKTATSLPRSIFAAMRILKQFKPDVVIGVGGYASGPAMLAAVLKRIPTLIFEPNVVPGFANRMVARYASTAAVHFEETGRWFRKFEVTGVPVRHRFFEVPNGAKNLRHTMLVFGGSQGARAINRVVAESVETLVQKMPGIHIIHQTGERDFPQIAKQYETASIAVEASPFIDDMAGVFSSVDLIVCRSGASTVAEIAAAGKPAIFIPLPTAADDHQRRNAEVLVKHDAAVMIPESELTKERFVETVLSIIDNPERLSQIGSNARKLSHPDAAGKIARMAAELVSRSRSGR